MKVAYTSFLYPNTVHPSKGTFIKSFVNAMRDFVMADVYVPTVRALPFTSKWRNTHGSFSEGERVKRIRYISLPNKILPGMIHRNISRAYTREFRNHDYDVIHFNWLYPDGLAIPAIRKLGYPVALTIHGGDWFKTKDRDDLKPYLYDSLQHADVVFTVGNQLREDILKSYPDLDSKIQVCFHPVDFNKFNISEQANEAVWELGWESDKRHILCVANITPVKGLDLLIEAVAQTEISDDVQFQVIGNVNDVGYKKKLEHLLVHHGITNFNFLNPVPHDQIHRYYQAAEFVVQPSRREGFGLSLVEAIACGKPALATESGGPADIIDETNGLLVAPGSPEALAEGLTTMLWTHNQFDPQEMRVQIKEKFDRDKITRRTFEWYQAITNQKSSQL